MNENHIIKYLYNYYYLYLLIAACPEKEGSRKKRCVNCSGRHEAWSRDCPEARKQIERAHQAYLHRPLQFHMTQGTFDAPANPQRPSGGKDTDGFQLVTNKRLQPVENSPCVIYPLAKRGRPAACSLSLASRGCQDIIMFARSGSSSSQSPATTLCTPSTQSSVIAST